MPRLICDAVPETEADYFIVTMDGEPTLVDGETADGLVRLNWELPADLSSGSHTATVAAVNMWGEGEPSDPFVFVKALPSKVFGVGLEV